MSLSFLSKAQNSHSIASKWKLTFQFPTTICIIFSLYHSYCVWFSLDHSLNSLQLILKPLYCISFHNITYILHVSHVCLAVRLALGTIRMTIPFHSVKRFCPICRTKKQLFEMMVIVCNYFHVPWTILLHIIEFPIPSIQQAYVRSFIRTHLFHAPQYAIFFCFQPSACHAEMYAVCNIIHRNTQALIESPIRIVIQNSISQLFRKYNAKYIFDGNGL